MGENSDELVLSFLRAVGVDVSDGVKSLGQFTPEDIVAACSRCLNVIMESKGEQQRFSEKLSKNPGARFQLCSSLATAITALGYERELGFNHLLYPAEADTRRLVQYVIDAMPKADGGAEGQASGLAAGGVAAHVDDEQIRESLKRAMAVPWIAPAWRHPPRRSMRVASLSALKAALARSARGQVAAAERQAAADARLQLGAKAEIGSKSGHQGGGGKARSGGFGTSGSAWPGSAFGSVPAAGGGHFARQALFTQEDRTPLSEGLAPGADGGGEGGGVKETPAQVAERKAKEALAKVHAELEAAKAEVEAKVASIEAAKAEAEETRARVERMKEELAEKQKAHDEFVRAFCHYSGVGSSCLIRERELAEEQKAHDELVAQNVARMRAPRLHPGSNRGGSHCSPCSPLLVRSLPLSPL